LSWHKQALRGLEAAEKAGRIEPGRGPILFCGMGGSGIVGDMVAALAYGRLRRPVIVVKDRTPPSWVNDDTLVVAVSYSGNTGETLECVEKAYRHTGRILLVSSGGRMQELAFEKNLPLIKITPNLLPRAALAELLYAVVGYLRSIGLELASSCEVEESIDILRKGIGEDAAKSIAELLYNKLPVVASTFTLQALAVRWKNELNENAKIPAKVELIPEWGHNDVVGWEEPVNAPYAFILIDDPGSPEYKPLLDFAAEWYERLGPVARVELKGEGMLAKLMYGSLLAGLASLELASMRGVDPAVTRGIALYKEAYKSSSPNR